MVAAGVLLEAALFFVVRDGWALVPLVYGFAARVLTGPTLSPLGQLATRVDHASAARRPIGTCRGRRSASRRAIGLTFTGGAALAWGLGVPELSYALIGLLVVAASLEAFVRDLPRLHRLSASCGSARTATTSASVLRVALASRDGCSAGRRPGHELISGTSGANVRSATMPRQTPIE